MFALSSISALALLANYFILLSKHYQLVHYKKILTAMFLVIIASHEVTRANFPTSTIFFKCEVPYIILLFGGGSFWNKIKMITFFMQAIATMIALGIVRVSQKRHQPPSPHVEMVSTESQI